MVIFHSYVRLPEGRWDPMTVAKLRCWIFSVGSVGWCVKGDYENYWLVVTGTMEFYDFPNIGNFIIPTDELIFFRGVETTIQTLYCVANMLGIMIYTYTYLYNNPRTGNPVLNQSGFFLVFNGMIEGFGIWCTPKVYRCGKSRKPRKIWSGCSNVFHMSIYDSLTEAS